MSRQTNLRTMEKRIYDLEKNSGGTSSVKWSDVTYKPFKTLDSNDFVVESDKLKLKNGGGSSVLELLSMTNNNKVSTHTNKANTLTVLNVFEDSDTIKLMGGWNITLSNSPSDADIEEMTSEELNAVLDKLPFIDEVAEGVTLTGTYDSGKYECKWEDPEGISYGMSYVYRPRFISNNMLNNIDIESNYATIYCIVY